MKCMKRFFLTALLLSFLLTSFAFAPRAAAAPADNTYILDFASLLTEAQASGLESRAAFLAEHYGTGVYILTVDDYTKYAPAGMDVFDFSDEYYYQAKLGVGDERNGLLLVLSMAERDYSLYSFGGFAESAFNGDAKNDVLVPAFRSYFSSDNWYGGLNAFMTEAEGLTERAANGDPYTPPAHTGLRLVIILAVSALVAFIVCSILQAKHKTVRAGINANAYVVMDSLQLSRSMDQFTHVTETRQIKESASSRGGGQSTGSHGGHGVSGKF